jgi:hypothetical protein
MITMHGLNARKAIGATIVKAQTEFLSRLVADTSHTRRQRSGLIAVLRLQQKDISVGFNSGR